MMVHVCMWTRGHGDTGGVSRGIGYLKARCERGETGERERGKRSPRVVWHAPSKRRGMHVLVRQGLWRH